jgi:V-type H+-transporting ATPase subunit a
MLLLESPIAARCYDTDLVTHDALLLMCVCVCVCVFCATRHCLGVCFATCSGISQLNPDCNAFQRNFVADVQRCDELERKLRYFEEQIRKAEIPIEDAGDIDSDERSGKVLIDDLEARFEELERDLRQLGSNKETLDRNQNQLIEMQHVLEKDASYFGHSSSAQSDIPTDIESVGMRSPLLDRTGEYAIRSRNLGYVSAH